MKKLEGKVAIVTGLSRGIGKEIAMKLAQESAKVVINYSCSQRYIEGKEIERVIVVSGKLVNFVTA